MQAHFLGDRAQQFMGGVMFNGFRSLSANFTPTPNQFFDEVLGHYPSRVVTVVGILVRSTLGWQDPDTGERRIEAELPLSSFIRPDLCENSARKGLAEAIAAGLIVRTVAANSREGARYALRWADGAALERALEKSRRAHGTGNSSRQCSRGGGPKNAPLGGSTGGELFRGPKNAPPYIDKTKNPSPEKKEDTGRTLNVGFELNSVQGEEARRSGTIVPVKCDLLAESLEGGASALVEELADRGSERRYRQLLSVCERNGLDHLVHQSLTATRNRMARESKHGALEKPGAYFCHILVKLLQDHQVFVPVAGEDDPEEVRRLARASLGLPATQAEI